MRLLAASLVVLVAICGSAGAVTEVREVEPNDAFDSSQHIPVTDTSIVVTGEILDVDDPADYFWFDGLNPDGVYHVWLTALILAIVHLDDTGAVLDDAVYQPPYPPEFEGLRPNDDGELYLAACSLDDGTQGNEDPDCVIGTTAADYDLTLEYIPEPGANALRLVALLCLAALARRRT